MIIRLVIVLLFLVSPAAGSGKPQTRQEKLFEIDVTQRRIKIVSTVCLREGPMEFLLCGRATKEHESILVTDVPASQIHGGLLALGLTAGKPAQWVTHNAKGGQFIPPQGANLTIILQWKGADGKTNSATPAKWFKSIKSNGKSFKDKWVFVGSQLLPDNTYLADNGGEIISVTNFPQAVIDVAFESSSDNTMLDFSAAVDAIPPVGTKVNVIIAPVAGARKSPHARAVIDIDRFGMCRVDAATIAMGSLRKWAREFVTKHPKAQVIIRPSVNAIIYDIQRAHDELLLGGLTDVHEVRPAANRKMLPRNTAEVEQRIKEFARDLAAGDTLLTDPLEDIKLQRQLVEADLTVMRNRQKFLVNYLQRLHQLLKEDQGRQNKDKNNGKEQTISPQK